MRFVLCTTLFILSSLPAAQSTPAPVIDAHQHLLSPAGAALVTGNQIRRASPRATLLNSSMRQAFSAHWFCRWHTPGAKASRAPVANEYEQVKAENDWITRRWRNTRTVCARSAQLQPAQTVRARGAGALQQKCPAALMG
jgi:hypothetical protein